MIVSFRSFRTALALLTIAALVPACAAKEPSVDIKGHSYAIEIAQDDASREHGLMDRTQMAADHGMLFEFQDDIPRAFWMKNTKIALDMLFFDAERRLVSVQHAAPPCTADPCPPYSSGAPARYVLELNAGQAQTLGLAPGDEMQIHR